MKCTVDEKFHAHFFCKEYTIRAHMLYTPANIEPKAKLEAACYTP